MLGSLNKRLHDKRQLDLRRLKVKELLNRACKLSLVSTEGLITTYERHYEIWEYC